jgi:Fe-only nitrogenase accessory protein AnfO
MKGGDGMNTGISKVAAFTDNEGNPADFFGAENLFVFSREVDGGWSREERARLSPGQPLKVADIRDEAKRRLEILRDCDALITTEISGIPYAVFDRAGIAMMTTSSRLIEVLAAIAKETPAESRGGQACQETDEVSRESLSSDPCVAPVALREAGVYHLDLASVLRKHPELSSKKILVPFLRETPFLELRLICEHVPPWLERDPAYHIRTIEDATGTIAVVRCMKEENK